MAITIRNRETEAIIRKLGERRNEGPSAVISRIAREALARDGEVTQEEFDARMKGWEELMSLTPPRDPNVTWDDIEREMQSLYDYLGPDENAPA